MEDCQRRPYRDLPYQYLYPSSREISSYTLFHDEIRRCLALLVLHREELVAAALKENCFYFGVALAHCPMQARIASDMLTKRITSEPVTC